MKFEGLYSPSPWGAEYHSLTVREALGAGSAGPGKSTCLLMDPVDRVIIDHERCLDPKHPYPLQWGDSTGWALHLRRLFTMLELTVVRAKRIFPRIDPDVRFDEQKHIFTFRSGYRIQFGHCQYTDSWEQYQSAQFDHIAYDELVQFDEDMYHNINSRLRSGDKVHRKHLKIRAMSNPMFKRLSNEKISVRDPHWVRKRFVDPAPSGRVRLVKTVQTPSGRTVDRDRIYLPARLYDNPDAEFVQQYEEELSDKPAHIRDALLNGNWYITPDGYYSEAWQQNLHVTRPFHIGSDWKVFRAMDWGYKTHGVVGWFAMDHDETLFMIREFSFREMEAQEVAKRIREYERKMGWWVDGRSALAGFADTNLWEKRGETSKTKIEEMADLGVGWNYADKNRHKNAGLLLGRLKDHRSMTQAPGIMFFEHCRMTIQTIPGIQADPDDIEMPAKGGDDHWHDMVLFACAAASHGSKGIPSIRRPGASDSSAQSFGRDGYGGEL